MYFHKFFHQHIFLKSTKNFTRTTWQFNPYFSYLLSGMFDCERGEVFKTIVPEHVSQECKIIDIIYDLQLISTIKIKNNRGQFYIL